MSDNVVEIQVKAEKKIQGKFTDVRAKKIHLRALRSQLRDALNGDKTYHELDLKLKDARTALNESKNRLENVPEIATLKEKIEAAKENLKSEQLTLSDWLIDYKEKTGSDTIPDDKGGIIKIKITKVVKTEEI